MYIIIMEYKSEGKGGKCNTQMARRMEIYIPDQYMISIGVEIKTLNKQGVLLQNT